ncbi:hypothetical protein LSH36_249g03073 [Paralvinella palmiformis]|uniref:TATA-binding protein-associated factor 172 n=1 Tax=Paralvinella palmiformis TaxID=53620 RepID=A0AAD9JL47_9ANNE|nr:hypothetical protein LSH36_249g03073 [Paralvinella palmiformis]
MTTRLDRLFLLLDTGSTPVIRKSAAEQLGEVQKLHPHELNNLLSKVHQYLCSSTWETRIAAGQAVEAIAKNVPLWHPTPALKNGECHGSPPPVSDLLQLSKLNIQNVLSHGTSLLASEGHEFEEEEIGLDEKDKLSRQKQLLNKRLGLDVAGGLGVCADDLYQEEDLVIKREIDTLADQQHCVKDLLNQQITTSNIDLSARERNKAKRKAKMLARQTSRENEKNGDSEGESAAKLRRTSSYVEQSENNKVVLDNVQGQSSDMEDIDEWPFEAFCEMLMNDLFHSSWEKRHGAATGLREVINLHGMSAGLMADCSADQMSIVHERYLEDIAVRLICVLALDRFGDYVSDEVVAPVRETCAQVLGVTIQYMNASGVKHVVIVIMQLLSQNQWEDLTIDLLPTVLPAVTRGIQDKDDDVRAVAAAALLPVTDILVTTKLTRVIMATFTAVSQIIECLWFTLLDLDDLTSSTNSIMSLLATLLAHPKESVALWLLPLIQDALRHIYQRVLLEEKAELLSLLPSLWSQMVCSTPTDILVAAASPWFGAWISLMMQPVSIPFDSTLLIEVKETPKEVTPSRARHAQDVNQMPTKDTRSFIGGTESAVGGPYQRDKSVIRARCTASRLLGTLCSALSQPMTVPLPDEVETPVTALNKLLGFHLNSKSAIQRFCTGLVIMEWAKQEKCCECSEEVKRMIHQCLTIPIYYDEIALSFAKVQADCRDFITALKAQGINIDTVFTPGAILTLDQAQDLCTKTFDTMCGHLKGNVYKLFDERRGQLLGLIEQTNIEQQQFTMRVQGSLAGAAIWLQSLPDKMNPVVRPVMEILKKEQNHQLQVLAAESISHLCLLCVGRLPCPTPKIIKNLITMLCSDPSFTPVIGQEMPDANATDLPPDASCDKYSGILTLYTQQMALEESHGRSSSVLKKASSVSSDLPLPEVLTDTNDNKRQLLIQRRGAILALTAITRESGPELVDKMPNLWEVLSENMQKVQLIDMDSENVKSNEEEACKLVQSLQVFEICGPAVDLSLYPKLAAKLPLLCKCLEHPFTVVRHLASRCLGMLGKVMTAETMNYVLESVLVKLGASDNDRRRQGAAKFKFPQCCVQSLTFCLDIIDQLGVDVIPYMVLLVVPILGCMSDQTSAVRLMATNCFATLIRLMPLESGIPDPPTMKVSLVTKKEKERQFLEQLLDGGKLKNYAVPVPISAELRQYQQEGVNWLGFLNKYKLHGILCDDMGLGKTLQSLCILAGDHHNRQQQYKKTKQPDCAPLPSIVVCPPTLTGHWVYEVEKFVQKEHLNPLHYQGPPSVRQSLQKQLKKHNLVLASYDVVRNDIDFFGKIKWNYCILDEGHIIKNSKTKISKAVKHLSCNHRLILSGTPIQNNVLELWSLFDFLMPGFLGTEKQFKARFGKPILQSRDAKSSSKEQEAGALAMEALHRQVLPFLLRRLKEDVLRDLPPKIIQDYYCDLSPLQVKLYEDFAKSRAKRSLEDTVHDAEKKDKKVTSSGTSHIFQALQYLRKVCNHPALVLTPQHPEYSDIVAELKHNNTSLHDLQHAPKLGALKQLLNDCGIGLTMADSTNTPVVNQHRVLLFCQLKSMLDIVEKDVLKAQMPSVTYLRLDGSVPPGSRHPIVNRFNNDPSIDILLLTTHVGGLGLNLTGADTVIFVEHDWNPMKDLQAMDRAHRIGQKKVVNVYRLVTRGTLEEKIMGLQKFKLKIANSIITQDNSSLSSMGTDQLLDLFSLNKDRKQDSTQPGASNMPQKQSMKSILENLEDIWDEKQYDSEYNLESFMKSLLKQ